MRGIRKWRMAPRHTTGKTTLDFQTERSSWRIASYLVAYPRRLSLKDCMALAENPEFLQEEEHERKTDNGAGLHDFMAPSQNINKPV
jgi:hypothetical protein